MRLLVVSHTPHHVGDGSVHGWGATVRELDHLATLVETLVHVAPLHEGQPPAEARRYSAPNIVFVPLAPAGGSDITAKLGIGLAAVGWMRTIVSQLRVADAVHVRAPANVAAVALALLAIRRQPRRRWVKYAGEWGARPGEPRSYRLQRGVLRHRLLHRSTVSVNVPDPRAHVTTLRNPALDPSDLVRGRQAAAHRSLPSAGLRLLFVGRLDAGKRPEVAVALVEQLRAEGRNVTLDVVGEGDDNRQFSGHSGVTLHSWLPRAELDARYAGAHVLIVPSVSEGFPKVIAEAAAYGVVPVAAAVGGVEWNLAGAGTVIARTGGVDQYAAAVRRYLDEPDVWQTQSAAMLDLAADFTYEAYLEAVRPLLSDLPASTTG